MRVTVRPKSFVSSLIVVALSLLCLPEAKADSSDHPKFEIRKFRYSRHNRKNFERLVVEFASKGKDGQPTLRTSAAPSGKEATINLDGAQLVGAIPEALINDSYVPKSKFMGPISINTDGPTVGFQIRTFLKQPVGVDAFWLDKPARLVLDVFPANSPRVEGRVPIGDENRDLARVKDSPSKDNSNGIVCYPLSSAVSASVSFHSSAFPMPVVQPDPNMIAGSIAGGTEPVICFLATSRVVASVTYKPKGLQAPNYVQWDPNMGQRPPMTGVPGSGGMMGGPPRPPASLPTPPNPMAGPPKPPVPPPVGGAPATPPPAGAAAAKPGSLVVPDVSPGKTPLGAPLVNPNAVQRLPSYPPPPKIPTQGALPGKAPGLASTTLLPPLK